MNLRVLRHLTVLSVGLLACSQPPTTRDGAADRAEPPLVRTSAVAEQPTEPSVGSMWAQQRLIRTAELSLKVDSVRQALAAAGSLAVAGGGFVADTRITQNASGKETAIVSLRIPSEHFDETLAQIRPLGIVGREVVHTEDVTKAYTDLDIRLTVKEATAARLRQVLASQTGKLADVLEVERELGRVTEEIESLKGERRYYDERIAYSTVTLTLVEPGALPASGAGAPIAEAFSNAIDVLSTSVAWLIYLLVSLVPWLVVITLGWWVLRRVQARLRAG